MPLPHPEDGTEVLTPGHFLVGGPLQALPDPRESLCPINTLRRWHLFQSLVRHLWKRWSKEYLGHLQRFAKWRQPSRNVRVGDVVCVHGEQAPPTVANRDHGRSQQGRRWASTCGDHSDGKRVFYRRPVTKIVPLIDQDRIELCMNYCL